ncbi:MAG TPA: hypothetical protein VFX59_15395 [Polyangiales bacterium]|nr:hypothetical protein [Polyangiales bacterium]
MIIRSFFRAPIVCAALLASFAGCAADVEEDLELQASRQALLDTTNGLRSINGLSVRNGLRAINGLTAKNGLTVRNGLQAINGLRTINGLRALNGLDPDCTGKVLNKTCSGEPDGMLDNTTGLMSTDEGMQTAKYLVRCALKASEKLTIKDYTGALVTLQGELGLTPTWKDGLCEGPCQEKISACLMALTNGNGDHIDVEMTAPFDSVGTSSSREFPYQEAAFYGNLFLDPPKGFYCIGEDYAVVKTRSIEHLATRACKGYTDKNGECPYVRTGLCNSALSLTPEGINGDYMCRDTRDTLRDCREKDGADRKWEYPITTHRKVVQN